MAEVLKGFEFPLHPRRAKQKYPWDEWTDGQVWQIVRGEDFDIRTSVMRTHLSGIARTRKLAYRSTLVRDGDRETLVFQFYKPEEKT